MKKIITELCFALRKTSLRKITVFFFSKRTLFTGTFFLPKEYFLKPWLVDFSKGKIHF